MGNLGNFWTSSTVSAMGSQVSLVGLPVIALTSLDAAGWQLGVLNALQFVPSLLFSLHLGRIVDRWPLRRSLVLANVCCAVTVALITALSALGTLELGSLCVLAFILGTLRLFVEIGNNSYGPAIFAKSELVRANSRVNTGSAVAETAGPGMAGGLIEVLSAPNALLVDSGSFLLAAIFLRRTKSRPGSEAPAPGSTRSLREGFQILFADRRLRILSVTSAGFNLCSRAVIVALPVYFLRELDTSAGVLGLCLAIGGAGGIVGAGLAGHLADKVSATSCLCLGILAASVGMCLMPWGVGRDVAAAVASLALFVVWLGLSLYNVHVLAYRQSACPPGAIGRVTASYRLISHGLTPVGAIAGGIVAGAVSARGAIAIAGLIALSSALIATRRLASAVPEPSLPELS